MSFFKTISHILFASLMALGIHGYATESAVILQYHHVADDTPAITSISPVLFARHLDFLDRHGYHVIALPDLVERLRHQQPLPDKTVAITFDDAYRSIYENAFPLLKKRSLPFTIFVNSTPVDRGFNNHSNWQQLHEMGENGATLASHSSHHDHLGKVIQGESLAQWQERVTRDILNAQARIEDETGQNHPLFAYPYGEFTPQLQQLIKDLGLIAFGQQSGPVGPLSDFTALPRFPMAADYATLDQLREKLNTRPLPVTTLQRPGNPLAHGSRPMVAITLQEALPRREQLRCYASGQGRISVQWLSEIRLQVQAPKPLASGRSRYNCTLPAAQGGYYWYSIPWLTLDAAGDWPRD